MQPSSILMISTWALAKKVTDLFVNGIWLACKIIQNETVNLAPYSVGITAYTAHGVIMLKNYSDYLLTCLDTTYLTLYIYFIHLTYFPTGGQGFVLDLCQQLSHPPDHICYRQVPLEPEVKSVIC